MDAQTNNITAPTNSLNNETMSKLERAHFVNIDKNIAARTVTFSQFGNDETLCRDLLIYICHKYQGNLFSFGSIDVADFCKVMNYHRSHLQTIVTNPFQTENLKKAEFEKLKASGKYIWQNAFENAIYKLHTIGFDWSYNTSSANGSQYHEETRFTFLDTIGVHVTPTGKTTKRVYSFSPNQRFMDNLSTWFLSVNLDAFISLRTYESLYLFCVLRKHLKQKVTDYKNVPVAFDRLLEISGYNASNVRSNKFQLTKAFNKIQEIDPNLGLSHKWIKHKGSSFAYSLALDFQPEIKSYDDKLKDLLDRFEYRLSHDLLAFFRSIYPHLSPPHATMASENAAFKTWVWDMTANYQEKASVYKNAKIIVVGKNAQLNPGEELHYFKDKALSSKFFVAIKN